MINSGCHYFDSILASVGWNKNYEFFTAEELFKAKDNCIDEPLNFGHEEFKIIGHINSSKIAIGEPGTDSFQILENPTLNDVLDGFHLITNNTLYVDYWRTDEQKMFITQLIKEMDDGKWFVSLELIPEDFDFVLSKDGVDKIVPFTNKTAFLVKHLIQYGGEGKFNGYKLGRLLKNYKFVGKGIVKQPANPTSFILSETNMDNKTAELEQKLTQANQELETTKAELVKAREATDNKSAEVSTLTASVTTLTNDKNALTTQVEALTAQINTVKEEKAALETATQAKDEAIAALKLEVAGFKTAERTNALIAAGIEKEKVAEMVESLSGLSEEAFSRVVAGFPKKEVKTLEEAITPNKEVTFAAEENKTERREKMHKDIVNYFVGEKS